MKMANLFESRFDLNTLALDTQQIVSETNHGQSKLQAFFSKQTEMSASNSRDLSAVCHPDPLHSVVRPKKIIKCCGSESAHGRISESVQL